MGAVIHTQAFPDARAARLASALLQRHSAKEIADAIEVLIDVLDALAGDPEAEDDGTAEPTGDERDIAWPEWHIRHWSDRKRGCELADTHGTEDDEEDDPAGQCDEDGINTALHVLAGAGPGCMIVDEDFDLGRPVGLGHIFL